MKSINKDRYRNTAIYGAGRALAAVRAKWPFDSLVISQEGSGLNHKIVSKLEWRQEGFPKTSENYSRDNWERRFEHDDDSDLEWRENLIRFSLGGAFSVRKLGTNPSQPECYPFPEDVKLLVDVGWYETEILDLLTKIRRRPFRNSDAREQLDRIMQRDVDVLTVFVATKFLAIKSIVDVLLKQIKQDDTGHVCGRLSYDEVNEIYRNDSSAWNGI